MLSSQVNPEGLTWSEWKAAAFGGRSLALVAAIIPQATRSVLLREWRKGVDPTEWRAAVDKREYNLLQNYKNAKYKWGAAMLEVSGVAAYRGYYDHEADKRDAAVKVAYPLARKEHDQVMAETLQYRKKAKHL